MKSRLGFDPAQVKKMPWHEERMWMEGVAWEISGFKSQESLAFEDDDLAAMGFTVRKV